MSVNEPIVEAADDFYMFRSDIQHFIKSKSTDANTFYTSIILNFYP